MRWEERLAAEAASLQRREEAHKVDCLLLLCFAYIIIFDCNM